MILKPQKNTLDFIKEFNELLPIKQITHFLTDNGLGVYKQTYHVQKRKLMSKRFTLGYLL